MLLPNATQPSSGWMCLPAVAFTPVPRSELGVLLNCLGAEILLPWVQDDADHIGEQVPTPRQVAVKGDLKVMCDLASMGRKSTAPDLARRLQFFTC